VVPCAADLPGGSGVCEAETRPLDWDGSYAELLAADALAECSLRQRVGAGGDVGFVRPFYNRLHGLMTTASCPLIDTTPPTVTPTYSSEEANYYRWLERRKTPECNANPASGQKAALDLSAEEEGRQDGTASDYYLPNGALPTPTTQATLVRGQVAQAHLDLCIALKLQEHLDSAQVVFASGAELEQLHRFVRDRALSAVHQYSVLVQVMSMPTASYVPATSSQLGYLVSWRQFALNASTATERDKLARIGDDYALAISTLVDATEATTELSLRQRDAQNAFGVIEAGPAEVPSSLWSDESLAAMFPIETVNRLRGSRVNALELTYGAVSDDVDPARESQTLKVTVPVIGFVPAYRMSGDVMTHAAVTDMSAPEIGVLLGLARAADGIELRAVSHRIDVDANAAALLRKAEQGVRAQERECRDVSPPSSCTVGATEDPDDYVIRDRFGITEAHARALVRALVEVIFQLPVRGELNVAVLDYSPVTTGDGRGLFLPYDLPERVRGEHSYTGDFATATGGVLHLDPDFTLGPGAGAARSHTWAYVPPAELRLPNTIGTWTQGGFGLSMTDAGGQLGTVPTLVFARHTLLRAGIITPLYAHAKAALGLLDSSIGPRSVLIRPDTTTVAAGVDRPTPFVDVVPFRGDTLGGLRYGATSCTDCPVRWRSATRYRLEVYRKPGDVFEVDHVAALAKVLDDSSAFAACSGGATSGCLLAPTGGATTAVEDGELLTSQLNLTADHQLVELRSQQADEVIFRGKLDVGAPRFMHVEFEQTPFGRAMAFGGSLNSQADSAWEVQEDDWSRPRYDAFGLPRNWTPSADASLSGGSEGEETYQYFLRTAKDAAGEATQALSAAADQLISEASDDLALQSAEERGETLKNLELQSLCGSSSSCDPLGCPATGAPDQCPHTSLPMPLCPARTLRFDTLQRCGDFVWQLRDVLGAVIDDEVGFPLAQAVVDQLSRKTPDFSEFAGGELEGLLLSQWSAWKQLDGAVDVAMKSALSSLEGVHVAQDENTAARKEYDATWADVRYAYQQVILQQTQMESERAAFEADIGALTQEVTEADNATSVACDDAARQRAMLSTISFGKNDGQWGQERTCRFVDVYDNINAGPDPNYVSILDTCGSECQGIYESSCANVAHPTETRLPHPSDASGSIVVDGCGSLIEWRYSHMDIEGCGLDNYSISNGPYYQYEQHCAEAKQSALSRKATTDARKASIQERIDGLDDQLEVLPNVDPEGRLDEEGPLAPRIDAAMARWTAAGTRIAAAQSEVERQAFTQLVAVQAALDRVLTSGAAIRRAVAQAQLNVARVELDHELESTEIKSRFALQRRFRSYDLWRARALSESARRLSVAARRAIESRFVVDLSNMSAPEPFVEAPAIWADEIYESDLKPTAALGSTSGPAMGGSEIAINKLEDYVTNLELFVNGYVVARPTTVATSDVEALQLAGPASVMQVSSSGNASFQQIDPRSEGWSFYCAETDAWFPHPGGAGFDLESFDLSSVCFGEAPTKAKLGFWLDPWGRLYGHYANEPFSARYNARWKQLAVNLVGSGIRDCSNADDVQACYAEPFVRFNLRHFGPAWVTSYEQQWREVDIPIAQIEAAKALSTEEWLDPVSNGFNLPTVTNVARRELAGRPLGGSYELELELTPDVRVDRIERIQILAETESWVRQEDERQPERDSDFPVCGDGVVEAPETCDGDCPTACSDDPDQCTAERLAGSPLLCNATCVHAPVTACADGDGCCADDCDSTNDDDCSPPGCGDGAVGSGEECDPGASGVSATCDGNCTLVACGDGTINPLAGETCEASCPLNCGDGNACTVDALTGSVGECDAECHHAAITACVAGDSCCPTGCSINQDADCNRVCGNSIVESGETCDGNCPASCDDGLACTQDALAGSASQCSALCQHTSVTACTGADGCCPAGCNANGDSDCAPVCGNGVIESGEACDGNCPTSCMEMDGDACTASVLGGTACNPVCVDMSACGSGNACCPFGCTGTNDNDCAASCSEVVDTLANHVTAGRATVSCSTIDAWPTEGFESLPITSIFNVVSNSSAASASSVAVVTTCGGTTTAGCAQAGTRSAQFRGSDPIAQKFLDTSGLSNVTLTYWRRASSMETGDPWIVDYSVDGGASWVTPALESITTGHPTTYAQRTNALPSNANLRLRFRITTPATSTDYMHLDTVRVTGQSCSYFAVGSGQSLGTNPSAIVGLHQAPPAAGWFRGGCPEAAAGDAHGCSTQDGELWCWGTNAMGQLGLGDATTRPSPVRVGTASDWTRVGAGSQHTCGVRGGALYCFGFNGQAQLGDGTTVSRSTPTQIGTATDWSAIAGGLGYSCGIRAGALYCWGNNASGQLGDGTVATRTVPVQVGTATNWTRIATGDLHSCGLRAGALYCWGENDSGQLGDGTTTDRLVPTQVGAATNWTDVATGQRYSCGINGGALYCWGGNTSGQLGLGDTTSRGLPTRVGTSTAWSRVDSSSLTTCGLQSGSPYCWGRNNQGQVGAGDLVQRNSPVAIGIYGDWAGVVSGASLTAGRRAGDLLYSWGTSSTGDRLRPVNITPASW
jgi:hypothetical protein